MLFLSYNFESLIRNLFYYIESFIRNLFYLDRFEYLSAVSFYRMEYSIACILTGNMENLFQGISRDCTSQIETFSELFGNEHYYFIFFISFSMMLLSLNRMMAIYCIKFLCNHSLCLVFNLLFTNV